MTAKIDAADWRSFSSSTTRPAPLLAASSPSAPLPANMSRNDAEEKSPRKWRNQSKSVSRTREGVGRSPSRKPTATGVRL